MTSDSQTTERPDDAPLTTSKDSDHAERAGEELVEPKGDSLSGVTLTINRPRAELFAFWRNFANLAVFMENIVGIEVLNGRESRWDVKAPAGRTVQWTSTITGESEPEFIAWASEEGGDVPNSGRVDFRDAPGGRGTWVTATILYDPPAGFIGKVIAKMFQREPAVQARRDLRRFKQLMETGEIATGARNSRLLEEGKN
ncbi:MAG: SRPBCC family protein [Sphingobium sp.]|nr:SRPBCC family protein [Sphingobium sp.]